MRNEYRRDDAMGQAKKPRNHLCKGGIVASALPMRPVSIRQTLKNASEKGKEKKVSSARLIMSSHHRFIHIATTQHNHTVLIFSHTRANGRIFVHEKYTWAGSVNHDRIVV